jgi:hypothetical protein
VTYLFSIVVKATRAKPGYELAILYFNKKKAKRKKLNLILARVHGLPDLSADHDGFLFHLPL